MFSSLTIHGCKKDSSPITLPATSSFPASVIMQERIGEPAPASWDPHDVSEECGALEVRLLDKISEGRIGAVYSAQVLSVRDSDGANITSKFPGTLCLKFAKPPCGRSLAREAWHYEQLEACQGVSVPIAYGLFSSQLPASAVTGFLPWEDRVHRFLDPVDFLVDDHGLEEERDSRGLRRSSRWNQWKFNPSFPTVTVLVLELLGPAWELPEELSADFRSVRTDQDLDDIRDLYDDVAALGLLHHDISQRNAVAYEGPDEPRRRCRAHGRTHRWRLIDFDRSVRIDVENADMSAKVYLPLQATSALRCVY